jgi:SAM-dependent methyltransferase
MPAAFDERYFREVYRAYELQNPPHKLRFYRRLVDRTRAGPAVSRVLDVGCAFGAFLDTSRYAVGLASQRLPEVGFAVASALEIPFARPFDTIVAFDVLEHVPALDAVRAELRSKLAAGGHLVFVVPVYDGLTGPLIRLLDRDPTHLHKRSRRFWLEWASAGFEVVDWWGIYRYLLPGGCYLHWPTRRLRHFTPAVAVVARRGD